jgi:hypothetical protein
MPDISYSQSGYPIHDGYAQCHNRFWDRLASPGAWLTAVQKIAVAQEVRHAHDCELCKQRKGALSPYQVKGSHDTASNGLSSAMVEMVHFIVTDPARLSKKWFEDLLAQGLTEYEYVEILGTIVHTLVIDEFCRALDIPLHDLPTPRAGEPSAYRPANASTDDGAWVPMLPPVIDEGPEADLWGAGAGVARAMSLVPDEVRTLMDTISSHYIPYESVVGDWTLCPNGGLNRIQMEVVAARVSSHNECFY